MLAKKPLGSPYCLTPSHNARCRDSTSGALEGGDRTFTNKVGALSTTELEAPNETTELHHNGIGL